MGARAGLIGLIGLITVLLFVTLAGAAHAQGVVGGSLRPAIITYPFTGCGDERAVAFGASAHGGYQTGRFIFTAEYVGVSEVQECIYDFAVPQPGQPAYSFTDYGYYGGLTTVTGRIAYRPSNAPVWVSVGGGIEAKNSKPVVVAGIGYRSNGNKARFNGGIDVQYVAAKYRAWYWNGKTTQMIGTATTWHTATSLYAGVELQLFKR